jgi:hypothetical protein
MKKMILVAFMLALTSACTTVTIRDQGTVKISSTPSYSKTNHFFFWGLVGHSTINVTQICGGKAPVQMQTEQTFVDGLLRVITLGIYTPRSAYVWCTDEGGA